MKVSVITPAFNASSTLFRAWQSLEAQTFKDWEHIVVDDGSTDDTAGVLSEVSDTRLQPIIRTLNGGTGSALNKGLSQAHGQYIAFLDADDEFLPEHLEEHVKMMDADPAIDLLWGGMELIVATEDQAWVPDRDSPGGLIHVGECVVQGTIFVRADIAKTLRYSEDRGVWYQDYDFVQRARAAGYECRKFPLPTYRYYRNSGTSLVDRVKAESGLNRSDS